MRSLKALGAALLLAPVILSSCISHGPLSPDQALSELQRAFAARDVRLVKKLLTAGSLAKIGDMTAKLSRMPEEQLAATASVYGIAPARMKALTVDDFITLYIATQQGVLFEVPANVAAVKESDDRAVVLLQNGNRLDFLREGPYWRFDLTGI